VNWLLPNKIFAFIGPKLRPFYALLPPGSLAVSLGISRAWPTIHRQPHVLLALTFYALSAAAYYCARGVYRVFCPDEIRDLTPAKHFYSQKSGENIKGKAHLDKVQMLEAIQIDAELTGVLNTKDRKRLAEIIAKLVHNPVNTIPGYSWGIDQHARQKKAFLAFCLLLLATSGLAYLGSVVEIFAPMFKVALPAFHGLG